ncbi:MAG: hypothetical protein K0R65_797 [Crocinitomicaceae bacterium]|nr:hypothetical protein [Crocinitomicaceae bacterium]
MDRVALVEFGGSHDECMHTQIHALKNKGCEIFVVTTSEVLDRNPFWKDWVHEIKLIAFSRKKRADFALMMSLNRYFTENSISRVVLNTAQGGHVRNLCLFAPRKVEFFGIIHTIRKFQGSFTQKLIHQKIKKYLLLSDDLLAKVNVPKGLEVQSFYPVYYPQFGLQAPKGEKETWITIAGGVEDRRKDLKGFVNMLKNLEKKQVKFIFLGKSKAESEEFERFREELEQIGKIGRVQFFFEFVTAELFDAYMRKTDFLLPLVHPGTRSAEQYITNQVSGMFNLAYGYQVPLLLHEEYASEPDFGPSAFFYHPERFNEALQTALDGRESKIEQIKTVEKWKTAYQEESFCRFLGL